MEQSFIFLLYLLLQRHQKILDLAERYLLSEMDVLTIINSLHSLRGTFNKRYRDLVESWRQQRLNVDIHIWHFAAGMFEQWHNKYSQNRTDGGGSTFVSIEWYGDEYSEEEEDDDYKDGYEDYDGGGGGEADYGYEEGDGEDDYEEDDEEDDDGGNEDNNEYGVEYGEDDDASMIDLKETAKEDPVDPLQVLVFPLATQLEVVEEPVRQTAEEISSTFPIPVAPKERDDTMLEQRVAVIETKLHSIEKLLKELLSVTKATMKD